MEAVAKKSVSVFPCSIPPSAAHTGRSGALWTQHDLDLFRLNQNATDNCFSPIRIMRNCQIMFSELRDHLRGFFLFISTISGVGSGVLGGSQAPTSTSNAGLDPFVVTWALACARSIARSFGGTAPDLRA
jgi:hypothetical protein